MAEAKRAEDGNSSDSGAGPKLPPGVTLKQVLSGHTDFVTSVAFDPQGGTLASVTSFRKNPREFQSACARRTHKSPDDSISSQSPPL